MEERRIAGGRVKAEFDYLVISGKFGNYLQNGIDSIEGGGGFLPYSWEGHVPFGKGV